MIWWYGNQYITFTSRKNTKDQCTVPVPVLGLAAQWSFWAMLEMEALLLDLLQHRAVVPNLRAMHHPQNAMSCC